MAATAASVRSSPQQAPRRRAAWRRAAHRTEPLCRPHGLCHAHAHAHAHLYAHAHAHTAGGELWLFSPGLRGSDTSFCGTESDARAALPSFAARAWARLSTVPALL
jgi:hypothetical protein